MKFSTANIVSLLIGSALGLLIGFIAFRNSGQMQDLAEADEKVKVVTEKVKDTVVVSKKVFVEVPVSDTLTDTLTLISDTIQDTSLVSMDTLDVDEDKFLTIEGPSASSDGDEEDIDIITDQLLRKIQVKLRIIESRDSLNVDGALNKSALPFNEQMNIEFWTSPLELTGYELSSNKLKLFGFHPDENIESFYTIGEDYLEVTIGDLSLKLKKAERFKTLYL